MELIIALFQAFSMVNDATKVGDNVADWVFEVINKWSDKQPSKVIERQVVKIAKVTEEEIRSAADEQFRKQPQAKFSPAKREEMIGIMVNMARNVRTQATLGSVAMVSGYFRSERLLDILLANVEPIRHINEPVAPGSPWILKQHLGMGSFGEVWKAVNPLFPTPRAYKFFTRDGSGEWLRRERESLVAILRRLGEHVQIVDFEDVQVDKCKFPYLAFEYLGGGSLEEWILRDPDRRPRMEVAEIVRQVTQGLADAHQQGIQHRDIKPANILLTDGTDPQIKIGDFGLANVTTATGARPDVSFLGSLGGSVGTMLYMPPEAQQRSFKRKAAQDDVFALGVVWFQLIMGAIERPPYDFAARLAERGTDSHTIRLIERCLAHPDRRFKDARELLTAIAGIEIPPVAPCPAGTADVQHLAREFLASTLVNLA